ncbi:MAG TPA: hypothetical protein VGH87_27120 [Polyangiaceae bacterium]|jgi:hypothetical protein
MRLALVCAFASLVGCATYSSTARDQFVTATACPADRVTVSEVPPDDAERVARGCGKEIRYTCETKYTGEGRRSRTNFPFCTAR